METGNRYSNILKKQMQINNFIFDWNSSYPDLELLKSGYLLPLGSRSGGPNGSKRAPGGTAPLKLNDRKTLTQLL